MSDKPDLEQDIRNAPHILNKVRGSPPSRGMIEPMVPVSRSYAQELYAALCNRKFFKKSETFDILKDDYWSCTWRWAGGFVAELRDCGDDYMDWYCSGNEGNITEQIKDDLESIGWISTSYGDGDD